MNLTIWLKQYGVEDTPCDESIEAWGDQDLSLPAALAWAKDDWRLWLAERIAVEHLPEMMHDGEWRVRRAVARRIAVEHLPEMMNDDEWLVREVVARRIAAEHLPAMMNDRDWDVRLVVAKRIKEGAA